MNKTESAKEIEETVSYLELYINPGNNATTKSPELEEMNE